MDTGTRRQRLDELPPTLAVALRLHDAGHPDVVVATALDVPVESVEALLQVARAKLARLAGSAVPENTGPGNQWSSTEARPGGEP